MANRWRKSKVNEPEYLEVFARITTIREVMNLYDLSYPTDVQRLINFGDISAVKICGTWILSLDSVVAWFGKPKHIA